MIKIEVWQIGDSKPAPRFEVVGIKNDWAASLKKSAVNDEPNARQLMCLGFWEQLCSYIRAKDRTIKLQSPKPRRYFDFTIGDSIAHVVLFIGTRKSTFTCELYINRDKQLLAFLKEREETLHREFGPFEWFEANVASGLFIDYQVENVFDTSKYDEYSEWCYQNVLLFKKVLTPLIKEFRQLA